MFVLALSQVALHQRRGRPDWQRRDASAVHVILFGLLCATPILGYLTAATARAHIPTLFLGIIPVPHVAETSPVWFAVRREVHLASAVLLLFSNRIVDG